MAMDWAPSSFAFDSHVFNMRFRINPVYWIPIQGIIRLWPDPDAWPLAMLLLGMSLLMPPTGHTLAKGQNMPLKWV